MGYKVVLCLLLSIIAVYADDKEEKVDAAVSLKDNFPFRSAFFMAFRIFCKKMQEELFQSSAILEILALI